MLSDGAPAKALRLILLLFHTYDYLRLTDLRLTIKLFYCHTLCEISWSVDILAFANGYVIGQQLQGDGSDERLETLQGVGQFYDVVGELADLLVALRH